MNVSNVKREGNRLTFTVTGITHQMANALRRIIISEVSVMAIERVTFYDNSSILADEILAHRLGLMPLKTDLAAYNFVSECTCKGKGCGKCIATLTLDLKGPKTVHASDMKSKKHKVVPVYGDTLLMKLTEHQSVKLEAHAQLGTGRDHIKWQAGLASYEEKNGSFNFFIESYGSLDVKKLVSVAFDTLSDRLTTFKSALK